MDELAALEFLKSSFDQNKKDIILGIGDDSAVIRFDPDKLVVTSTDSIIENQHFLIDKIKPREIGYKAVAVSVSDIGAMGGEPRFILSTIGFKNELGEAYFKDIIDGIKKASAEFSVELIGGNLSGCDNLFIDITSIGQISKENIVERSKAKANDDIYVTGFLGDSALGLQFIKSDNESEYLISRHIMPKPRLGIGKLLGDKKLASSMIDVSDGLNIDLGRITTDYGLGAEIKLEHLPLSEEYRLNHQIVTNDIYNLAVSGGEDYELLFTSDPSNEDKIYELSQKNGIAITKIGKVNETGLIKFIDENNFIRNFQKAGFVHFS